MATHKLNLLAQIMTALKGTTPIGYPTSSNIDANTQALDVAVHGLTNVRSKVRDALEAFSLDRWSIIQQGANDIVGVDGNTASSSYLIISKSPLDENTETIIETINTFNMPYRLGLAPTLSQRIMGQEHVVEAYSVLTDLSLAMPVAAPVALATIQQATTTLTLSFSTPHGLLPGDRFSVYGVTSDLRLNYPLLTVASLTASGLGLTATSQPGVTIPSLTVGPFNNQGSVQKVDPCGYARNSLSIIYDGSNAANLSYFVRSEGGSALPSGTVGGSQQVSLGSTTANQLVTAAATVSFAPAQMLDMIGKIEGVSISSVAVDSATTTPTMVKRTQVVPNPDRDYKLRLRSRNDRSFTKPVAKIVSAAKSGTTTATITTDVAHSLVVGDQVGIYGLRDQASFINTQSTVVSVPNSTSFTIVMAGAVTATSYGGMVVKVNGGNQGGFNAQAGLTLTRASNVVTLLTTAATAGLNIGELINLHGVRNAAGADMGVDGAYRIRDITTTTPALVLEPVSMTINSVVTNYSPTGADIGSTSVGGAIIKRTDYRLHFVRAMDNDKLVVEFAGGGRPDRLEAVPVLLTDNSVNMLLSGGSPASVQGPPASSRLMGILPGVSVPNADRTTSTASTASGTSGTAGISDDFGAALSGQVVITSMGGTSPTLDVTLEETYDGTTFLPVYQLPRITANGTYSLPPVLVGGRRRWSWVIGGTTPTMVINISTTRLPFAVFNKQFFDRAVNPNTANSVSASFPLNGLLQINARSVISNIGSGVPPQIAFDVSDDGTNWVQLGAATFSAVGTQQVFSGQQAATYGRFRTLVAGTGAVLNVNSLSGVN